MLDRFRQKAMPAPRGSEGLALHFVAIDVETTGLSSVEDRIIEIALVIFDAGGNMVHEWTTLVNPGTGKSGPMAIHGIQREWLIAAPTFADIAGDLVDRLVGRVIVVHNARFDIEFLESEFRRLGAMVESDVTVLDTMNLADQFGLPRKLARLAGELGIAYQPHSAIDDARATMQVLARLLPSIAPSTFARDIRLRPGQWPSLAKTGRYMHRKHAANLTRPHSILADAIADLRPIDTPSTNPEAAAAYLTLLERVMEDGYVSPEEGNALLALAREWKLTQTDIELLHREFLDALLDAAMEDRRLSKEEREDLTRAATWLGIEAGDFDLLVTQARARGRARVDSARGELRGKQVAFTGRGIYSNSIREGLCAKYGIGFKSTVSAECVMLVVGTDDLQNTQVLRGREMGVAIIAESGFWERLGEKVPAIRK